MRLSSVLCAATLSVVMTLSGSFLCRPADGAVIPPEVRALELPEGVTAVLAEDPFVQPILGGARSTAGGKITQDQAGKTLQVGKTLVTWRDSADGKTLARYVYLYPHGWQVLAWSKDLHTFEHNGARHVLHDRSGRVHIVYTDGRDVWYRLGKPARDRVDWQPAVALTDSRKQQGSADGGARAETFALTYDQAGRAILTCAWSSTFPAPRSVYIRRVSVDGKGNITLGDIVNTWLNAASGATSQQARGSFSGIFRGPMFSYICMAADSKGGLHMVAEQQQALVYAYSKDGVEWARQQVWSAGTTGSREYRYPSLAVDSRDNVHLIWQTMGYRDTWGWWVPLYTVRDPRTGKWSPVDNPLVEISEWREPKQRGQDVLFAYPDLLIDDRDNVHVGWHGTCKSHVFGRDDVFYISRPYNKSKQTWDAWTKYAVLHQRDHFEDGQGEDADFSWVPSLAYKRGTGEIYAMIMFGPVDDEADPKLNATDGALKIYRGGQWQRPFENLTQTKDLRSWYPNLAPDVWTDETGRDWLDLIWLDGTKDDYHVIFRRVEVSTPAPKSGG